MYPSSWVDIGIAFGGIASYGASPEGTLRHARYLG